MRGPALAAALTALLAAGACTSVALDELLFACAEDGQCARGTRCHPLRGVCAPTGCGDGVLEDGERCDDGNTTAGDGCDATCALEPGGRCAGSPSVCTACGDGVAEGDEQCDDGNGAAGDGCDADCALEPGYSCDASGCYRCGDGVRDPSEACDDGGASGACLDCRVPLGASCSGAVGEASVCFAIRVRKVAAGGRHTCIVDGDLAVQCAGSNVYSDDYRRETGQATPPADLPPVAEIAAGYAHTCVVTVGQGQVRCWGANFAVFESGGVTDLGQATVPADLPPARAIAAGNHHTCAVLEDDTVRCWGNDLQGQARPPEGVIAAMVSGGSFHSCGIRADDARAFCFGQDHAGRITPPDDTFATLDVGLFHTCGINTAGRMRCWGLDTVPPGRTLPIAGDDLVEVASGHYFNCVRRRGGALACNGIPRSGDEGVLQPPSGPFSLLTAGFEHACAVRPDGPLECWGKRRAFLR